MYYLAIFIKSFLSLFAVMRLCGISVKNPLSLVLFMVFAYIFSKFHSDRIQSHVETADPFLAGGMSMLFTIFTLCAQYSVILDGMENQLFCIIILLFSGIGLLIVYYHLILWILQAAGTLRITTSGYSYAWLPYATSVLCIVCWLPYFLYEYPGIMTPDSINQYAQVIGAYQLSNHHSIVHTGMIGLFYSLGVSFTGDIHFGIALYTIAQMVFMAFVAGYVIKTLQKASVRFSILILTISFYALMPYHGILSVTLWKDIPFAGCMTLFTAALMRFLLRGNFTASAEDIPKLSVNEYFTLVLPYSISCILLCLLRSNGWYVFVIMVPFILIIYRKCPKFIIPVHMVILVMVLFIKVPVMNIYAIPQADFVESLSVPAQQIARVFAIGEPLSKQQTSFVEQLMDIEQIPDVYQPDVSDNIKNLIRQRGSYFLSTHKADFFKVWFSIGVQHPKAYLDAYVEQTKGYWYPDISSEAGLLSDGIYPNEFGLTWQPILRGTYLVKIKEILLKLPDLIPLYGILWSMGSMFWLCLLAIALNLRVGKIANALVCLPSILLILTLCIATPVSNEFRYAYPVFYTLPLLVLSPFIQSESYS